MAPSLTLAFGPKTSLPRAMNLKTRLEAFSPDNVEARLKAALRRNDKRSLAVRGYGLIHPSDFNDEIVEAYVSSTGFRIIPMTSDFICGPDHRELNRAAYLFAKLYNDQLIAKFLGHRRP